MATEEGMLGGGLGAKLKCPTPISRLRVEKIEGGLMVAGVVIAANCQIALPAFGTLFMLVGAVLTGIWNLFSLFPFFNLSLSLYGIYYKKMG